ncbi:hypothetical protein B0I35DRAFT_425159 [Stachybotrys elegans]|uniref:Uncharacterized protein n=1 Tax=Stachybotrys elegans TaxID=80388 RepID=A0A8K0SU81_9HYPO|nr:hypothetical protein B0I35DRAFT_425159 [Stachybotrys elegans]
MGDARPASLDICGKQITCNACSTGIEPNITRVHSKDLHCCACNISDELEARSGTW